MSRECEEQKEAKDYEFMIEQCKDYFAGYPEEAKKCDRCIREFANGYDNMTAECRAMVNMTCHKIQSHKVGVWFD